jgi:hypothetical protein
VYLFGVSLATMATAGLIVGLVFRATGGTPTDRAVTAFQAYPSWNVTTGIDIAFLLLTMLLGARFVPTGGMAMLRAMNHPAGAMH